jgi:hypothetical protein
MDGLKPWGVFYGAVALRFGSALVSRDGERLTRLATVIQTFHPRDVIR